MTVARFVVTGCGRSGTGFMADLLPKLGVDCGHEAVFRVGRWPRLQTKFGRNPAHWSRPPAGDSSWLAAPYVLDLPAGSVVLHQVRHPLKVVRSILRMDFLQADTPYTRFAYERCPALVPGPTLERVLRYWVEWNALVERAEGREDRAYMRYRLEDVGPELVCEILERLGAPMPAAEVERVMSAQRSDVNTRGAKDRDSLEWSDLPAGELRRRAEEMATRYGYELG